MTGQHDSRIESGALNPWQVTGAPYPTEVIPYGVIRDDFTIPDWDTSSGEYWPTFLVVSQLKMASTPIQLSYNPKPADDKIEQFLKHIDHAARPAEIARETGFSQSYVTTRCKAMWEADQLNREEGSYIIGHNIPGMESPVILPDDREQLLEIVERIAPEQLSESRSKSLDELRKFIKQKHATATFPLPNRKVSYAAE